MKIILFEDNQVESLYPISLTRPAFSIFCGGVTLVDLLKRQFRGGKISFLVRDYLAPAVKQYSTGTESADNKTLFLNARLVPSFEVLKQLTKKMTEAPNQVFVSQKQILGLYLAADKKIKSYSDLLSLISKSKLTKREVACPLFEYPWQVITYNEEILGTNLEYLKNDFKETAKGVYLGKNVVLPKEVVLDTTHGPIIINDGTTVLPFVHLVGPLYLGRNCLIREFTILKYSCCLGDVCKVAGEIEASVFQGFGNKNHAGFLGYSYLGEWVNLGAGTTNSNLKNNYGSIKMAGVDTGRQFLGCVLGDYTRSAINTTIYTGKIVGVSSHLYGTVTQDIPAFTHYARDYNCVVEFGLDQAIKLQKTVFARRNRQQTNFDIELIKKAFALTQKTRKTNKIKPGKIFFYGR